MSTSTTSTEGAQAPSTLPTLRAEDLLRFTGTDNWYRHALVRGVLFTDGAKYVADTAGAYWLIDEIALAQRFEKAVIGQPFQLWRLVVKPDSTANLRCEDGNGKVLHSKHLTFTDFPLPEVVLYCVNNTIHLPSEY